MIPTPDKLGLYYPSKDLTQAGMALPERSVVAGSTSMAIKSASIAQATGYWDGALGFFYGPTTQPELRGQTFHVRKWVKDEGCLYITSPLPVVPADTDKFKIFAGGKYASTQEVFGLIGQFGDDILKEQASRTGEVNEFIESQQIALYEQLASIEQFGCMAESLAEAVRSELEELANHDKWL